MPRGERPLSGEDSTLVQFAADLRRLRERAGLPSYRELARRAHYSATTLSDAAGGRQLPTLAVVLAYVRACDGDVAEWERRWQQIAAERVEQDGAAPYSGLAALQVEDADRFFGRGALLEEIVDRLARSRFLAVVGASGVGKSSLLRAGLVARLRAVGLGGCSDVAAAVMTPGTGPVDELAARLAEHDGDGELVVVIDQFEEVFTHCRDREERACFIASVMEAARGRTRVVIGLRADFFAHCADYPELRMALADSQVLVGAMTAEELRQMVVGPAEQMGYTVEGSLVASVVADAAERGAALPLLSHALLETWQRRQGKTLTLADYRAAGGIGGALARTAEDLYAAMGPERRRLTRQLFLRLTAFGEGTQDTRRRIARDELDTDDPDVGAVLGILAQARLVTLDESTVELTHEALITAWPRLHRWLVADRDDLRTYRRLTEAVHAWKALGRDSGALYRGAQLAIAREWADRDDHRRELNPAERAFLDAGIELEDGERTAKARRDRQLRYLMAGLVVLLIIVVGVAFVAVGERGQAIEAQQIAISRQLSTQAQTLVESRPDTAMLLSVQAYRLAPTAEARSAVLGMSMRGAYQAQFTAHVGPISELTFSPDGHTLLTASADHTIAMWDAHDHHRIASLTEHDTWLRAVAMTPDGSILASGGDDHQVMLWHAASRVPIARLSGHAGPIKEAAFSPDGRLLATGGADDTVIVWDVGRRAALARLTGHSGGVFGVAFSPDGRLLAAAGTGRIVLWDVATRKRITTLRGHAGIVHKVAFDRDGRRLASAGVDSTVRLWNVSNGSATAILRGHEYSVIALAFSPDGTTLASAGNDKIVRLWDVDHGVLRARLIGHTSSIYTLAFASDATLASGGEGGSVIVWDTRRASLAETAQNGIHDLAFSPDGRLVAEAADDRITLWDTTTRARRAVLRSGSIVYAVAFSPDGRLIATAHDDGSVALWSVGLGRPMARLAGHREPVLDVGFSPDGHTLATGGVDATAIVWDVTSHTRLATLTSQTGPINGVTFSPDGRTLATAAHDYSAMLWNTADWSPRVQLTGHNGWVRSAAFSSDGRIVATASSDNTVRLWDTATGAVRAVLTGHVDPVFTGLAFSSDGTTLAFTSGENTITLWNVVRRATQARLAGPAESLRALTFSPDGRTLAAADSDDTVLFWDTDAEKTARHICAALGRDLTVDEWRQFIPDLPRHSTC
ncbi:helix-turn-helix domain-containing protein [Nonomuraea sp. NBC_00507]|uniref:nSTAND1 domain-containing NTPase n=1 Tax=Nonomuraea sp. NBC_00507 TaxID=2976002 RepID=UPI002E195379